LYAKLYEGGWSGWLSLGSCLASGPGADAWAPDWYDANHRSCNSPPELQEIYWNGGSWIPLILDGWP
jgi:hypothetical protein